MDTTLVTVTLLSMGMAGALSVMVWRMLRDEKQRADSRVAALVTLAAADASERAADLPIRTHDATAPEPLPLVPPKPRSGEGGKLRSSEGGPVPPKLRSSEGGLFVERHEESPWRRRGVVMAALALGVASAILFTLTAGDRTPARAASGREAAGPQQAAAAAPLQAGLELVSLRDTRVNGALTITGLVHNPRAGAMLSRVTATAYAFDENGTFLASGRALLDVTSLVPGDESPFVVSVPVTGQVARYRIGFRGEDGRVIAHVDKRQQGPVAALREVSGRTNR